MAELGAVQIKQEPPDEDYQLPAPDVIETGMSCNGNSATHTLQHAEIKEFNKGKKRTKLKTMFGNDGISQSQTSSHDTQEVSAQNINQSGKNFQKNNLKNYQMYIERDKIDDSYVINSVCNQTGVTGIGSDNKFIGRRPAQAKEIVDNRFGTTVISGFEELASSSGTAVVPSLDKLIRSSGTAVVNSHDKLVSSSGTLAVPNPEKFVSSSGTAEVSSHKKLVSSFGTVVVPNCEKLVSHKNADGLQHSNLELGKSAEVSKIQKSHKKLSGLLSNSTNFAGTFDLLSSSTSIGSSATACKPTRETEKECQDKNGELLQMLLTKGPSSYVRSTVVDSDISTRHINNDALPTRSSSTSSLAHKVPMSVPANPVFLPKTSSPALRKILGSKSSSNHQDSLPLSSMNSQNLSQNVEMTISSPSTSSPGQTAMNLGLHSRRLDATIKKLLAKQTEDKTIPNSVPQGVKDLMKKSARCDINASCVKVSSDVNHVSCSNGANTQNVIQIKQEPIENENEGNSSNMNEFIQSTGLVDNFLETDHGKDNSHTQRKLVKENNCRGLSRDDSSVRIEKGEQQADVNKIKPNINSALNTDLLDEKMKVPVSSNSITDVIICPSEQTGPTLSADKYKTLQQHLVKPPTISPQIPVHSKPAVFLPKMLKGSVPRKRKSEDDEWVPPGGCQAVSEEPVKRPFMEKPLFYKCYECGKAFEHKGTLKVHERMHSMEKQEFKCDICGKVCSAKGYLEIHMRTHRREFTCNFIPPQLSEIPSKDLADPNADQTCTLCGKSFNELENLLIHMRMHSGEKLYKCEVCGNGFTRKTQLSIHMRIHTGEKPYECEVCGKTFRQSNGLNLHMTTHTDDKPYKCEICGGGFGRKAHYEKHMRKHRGERPFLCGVCSKGFTDKFTLSMHMKIHNKKKDHVCDICNKGFNQSTHLRNHMRFHTEEKGYRCEECNMLFEHKRSSKNHFKSAHPEAYHASVKLKRQERNKRRAAFRKSQIEVAKKTDNKDDHVTSASEGENGDSDDETSSSEDDSDNDNVLGTKVKEEPHDVFTAEVRIENVEDDDTEPHAQNVIEGKKVHSAKNAIKQEILGNGCSDLSSETFAGQDETEKQLSGSMENTNRMVNEVNAGNVGSEFVHFHIKQEPVDDAETFLLHSSSV